MPPASYLTIQELLMRYGVEPKIAKKAAMSYLRHWEVADLKAIFDKIKDARGTRPFLMAHELLKAAKRSEKLTRRKRQGQEEVNGIEQYFHKIWPSVFMEDDIWLSAPRHLMELAAQQQAALCINEHGKWSIMSSGYIAISHVWIEGLQRDDEHRGVPKSRVDLIFHTLKQRKVTVPWIWLDVLSIPGGGAEITTVAEELLKIDIINSLAAIYANADFVAIFDSLAWRLASSDPIEVGVVMCCGLWSSRLWTLQEIKLAKRAIIITRDGGFVEWSSITDGFAALKETERNRYYHLWLWFTIPAKNDTVDTCVRDLSFSCSIRETGNQVDYARAFFPLLGLKWKHGMTREKGMQEIYLSQIEDATRMMFLFGKPRLSISPTWAPSSLTGLEGVLIPPLKAIKRGVQGTLPCAKITSITGRFQKRGKHIFQMKTDSSTFQCYTAPEEPPSVPQEIEDQVRHGHLYVVLPNVDLATGRGEFAWYALLVTRIELDEEDVFEASVLCAVVLPGAQIFPAKSTLMLIRNGQYDHTEIGSRLHDALRYAFHKQTEESRSSGGELQKGEHPIHRAVRNSNLALVHALVKEGVSLTQTDSYGLTALHISASRGENDILRFLAGLTLDLELATENNDKSTALSLAAKYNKAGAIEILADYGANVNAQNGYSYTPLMVASTEGSVEAVQKLIELGADLKCGEGTLHGSLLMLTCSNSSSKNDRIKMAQVLLSAGVPVNDDDHPYGWTPLHRAVEWSCDEVIMLLLENGADVDAQELNSGWTPLKYAIDKRNSVIVSALLDKGAKCDTVFRGGWTPAHLAASCPEFNIMHMLLEKPFDINARLEGSYMTPLHISVLSKLKIVAKMLLEAGADPSARLDSGKTAFDLAKEESAEMSNMLSVMGSGS